VAKILAIAWTAAFAAAAAESDASSYAVRYWTRDEGLPQNTVFALCQQRDGMLVVGTEEGAVSFDGGAFHHIANEQLQNPRRRFVMALLEDEHGLWIGTLGDGVIHRPAAPQATIQQFLKGVRVRVLAKGKDGDIWIGTKDGVSRLREGHHLTHFGEKEGFMGGEVFALAISGDTVWAAPAMGVQRFAGSRWDPVPALNGESISAIAGGAQDRLWFATADGKLGSFDGTGRVDRIDVPAGMLGKVNALLEEGPDSLWIASRNGVFLRRKGSLKRVPGTDARAREGLALLEDREHNIWVGLRSGGLLRLRRTALTVLGKEAGLLSENVSSVAGDGSGGLWVGTEGGGVAHLRDGRVTATYLAKEAVNTVFPDGKSGAYVGLAGGGVRHVKDGRASRLPELAALDKQSVYALLRDDRERLWIGTHGQGVYWLERGRLGHLGKDPERGLPDERVFALEQHRGGGAWVGTRNGVALVQDGSVRKHALGGVMVLALHEDADGVLWIGTDSSGLHWLRDETHGSVSRDEGLVSNVLFQILEEPRSTGDGLWMSCNHGIFRASKGDLFALQEKRIKRLDVETITRDDGMEDREANGGKQPAGWTEPDGSLWFATDSGAVRVDPRSFTATRTAQLPVRIEAVLADGAAIADLTASTTVPPGRGRLEIRYAPTSLASPEGVRYRYRLVGFDDDWVEAGEQTVARYTNLPPGTYQFAVRAARGKFWSEVTTTGTIELLPQFYQTWWFRVVVAVVVVLLGVAAYQARVRRWRAETMVLAERNRLAREIHDGLMQNLTGILIQLQAAVALWSSGREGPLGHVERALEWARYSMADARLAVTSLGREVASVKVLAEVLLRCAEALTSGTQVRAEVKAASEAALPPKVGAALLRIGQEAMGNAVRHGRPRLISVEVTANAGQVRMAVKDDGRGFDASEAVSSASNGLRNMRERAQAIGGRHEIHSTPGKGTEVIVVAPLAPAPKQLLNV